MHQYANVRFKHSVNYARNEIALFEHYRSQSVHPVELKRIESTLDT